MNKIFFIIVLFALMFFNGCNNTDQQEPQENLDKTNCLDVTEETQYTPDSSKIVFTTHLVLRNNNNIISDSTITLTAPALGKKPFEDENGDTVQGREEYDIYYTAKAKK